jgi:malonyl-ACP O-methyltransferase BioC
MEKRKLMITSVPSKNQIAKSFGLKATSYESNARIQKKILSELIPFLKEVLPYSNGLWADLGCGTGLLEKEFYNQKHSLSTRFLCIDLAGSVLKQAKRNLNGGLFLQSDIDRLPVKENSLSGVIISSVLQWFTDQKSTLKNISDNLEDNGYFVFSIFINGSFPELLKTREFFNLTNPVNLPEEEFLKEQIESAGLKVHKWNVFNDIEYFSDANNALKNFSHIGSAAVSGKRLSRTDLIRFCEHYQQNFSTPLGCPVTYRSVTGIAVKRSK